MPDGSAGLVLRHSGQCPFLAKAADALPAGAQAHGVELELARLTSACDHVNPPRRMARSRSIAAVLADHASGRTRSRNILRQEGLLD